MPYYRVSLQHNDSYAFRGDPALTDNQRIHQELVPDMSGEVRSEPRRCAVCGALTSKWNEPLSELVIKKRTFDLSITYDGVLIASQRLKSIYDRNDLSGLVFRPLPHDPMFLAVYASRLVEFDFTRRNTRFIAHCSQCGQYESVVGAIPVYLKGGEIGEREFARTDLQFGTGDEKHPHLLCGESAANALKRARLRGVDLIAIDRGDV